MSDFPDDQTRLLNFLLENGPPLERAYYSAIGRAVVMWSSIECGFDIEIWTVYHTLEGYTLAPRPPRALGTKIDFWENCFRKLEPLAEWREVALELAADLRNLSSGRRALLHTDWSNVIFADREEAIEGVSFKATKDGHELHRRQMTLLDLNAFAADCEALNLRLLALSSSIQHLTRDRPAPLTLK
jgi:hypothetical protein